MNNNNPRANILSKLKEAYDWIFNPPISFKIFARVKELKCWELSSSPCTTCSSCLTHSAPARPLTWPAYRSGVQVYITSPPVGRLPCMFYHLWSILRCLQQAIAHSPATKRLRAGAEALGWAAQLPSAVVWSGDTSWGPPSAIGHCLTPPRQGELCPTRSTWELWGPHGNGAMWKETMGMGKVTLWSAEAAVEAAPT